MFDNVLVGVDGRQGGRDAIALAKALASPAAKLTLAHIYGGHSAGGRVSALAIPFELEASEELLARAANELAGQPRTAVVYESSVGRGLHELAEARGVDLLVVGSCHRRMLGRALLGDDTRAALNGSPCAVAIAPGGYAASAVPPARIGVGFDGSHESEQAMAAARQLAARHGARIKALSVVSLQSIPDGEPLPEDWPKIAGQLVVEEAQRLSDLEGVDGDATYGDPGEELATFSGELDLLIVGSRSYGPLGRLFNGSTSNHLVRRARCPLLVLPRSAHQDRAIASARDRVGAVASLR